MLSLDLYRPRPGGGMPATGHTGDQAHVAPATDHSSSQRLRAGQLGALRRGARFAVECRQGQDEPMPGGLVSEHYVPAGLAAVA
jgi:hypothetical protein